MYISLKYSGRKIHSTHSSIQHVHDNLKQIQLENLNTQKIVILRRSFLATRYVAATFHPTIGQCAHQPLNNTTTPKSGMIP